MAVWAMTVDMRGNGISRGSVSGEGMDLSTVEVEGWDGLPMMGRLTVGGRDGRSMICIMYHMYLTWEVANLGTWQAIRSQPLDDLWEGVVRYYVPMIV